MITYKSLFAVEILKQLGGNRFVTMTGAKHFVYSDEKKTLTFQLPNTRNKIKAKYCTIHLNGMDTYDMKFQAAPNRKTWDIPEVVLQVDGIYNDQLQTVFTKATGLYTHL